FLFWLFAIVMLVFGALVVINRNPIASALSLVICFLGLSALFMSLDAFFIGIIQVLVYAGAVMVLFLFIIMLLDLRAEERRKMNWVAFVGGFLVAFSLLVQILAVIGSTRMGKQAFPPQCHHHFHGARADVECGQSFPCCLFAFSSRRRWLAQLQRAGARLLHHHRCCRRSRSRPRHYCRALSRPPHHSCRGH